jgi:putative DNA primase/helicase
VNKGESTRWEPAQLRELRAELQANPALAAKAEQSFNMNTGVLSWPIPEPLGSGLPPVIALELSLLPDALRAWVADIAERMQVPLDAPAACAIVALAGCVSRRALIQPKAADTSFQKVPNLWGGIVLPSGFLKSPVLQHVTRPLARIEAQWRLDYEGELSIYSRQKEQAEIELSVWRELSKREIKKGKPTPEHPDDDPEEPVMRRLVLTDSTFEKLHEIMRDNPAGVLMIRDELTGWLAELEREGRQGERAFCLSAWNGDSPFTIDRIGRGSIHVPACCLSILGGIQPSRLRSYLSDALRDGPANDGLMQRFQILIWPDTTGPWKLVDRPPDAEAEARVAMVFEALVALSTHEPKRLRFEPDAQELYYAWWAELESKVRGNELHPALVSHLAKYRSLMPSLALLFELADWASGGGGGESVSLDHARQAAAWCEYLESHAQRVYSCIVAPELRAARELAEKIKAKRLARLFSVREVYIKNWSSLDTPESARAACRILEEAGWIRELSGDRGRGRPSERYEINPRVWK